jgi:hypothetical protein
MVLTTRVLIVEEREEPAEGRPRPAHAGGEEAYQPEFDMGI